MNKSAFLELIQQASTISDQQTEELEKVAATFPYCQTAHLLLAKSAHDKGSMLSTQRLRRASAYANNRQVLKRMIYTSPAPVPEFEEPSAEPETAIAPEAATLFAAIHQEEPEVVTVPENFSGETETTEERDEEITAAVSEPLTRENQPDAPAQGEAEVEDRYIYKASRNPAAEDRMAPIQDPEEGTHFELAHLLTINSLSHSFTDLLARKEEPKGDDSTSEQHTQSFTLEQDIVGNETPAIVAEPESGLKRDETIIPEGNPEGILADEEETAAIANTSPAVAPEAGAIIYTPSEIDQMYAADALGYWMASSRLGETLQLKDEVTRQRPVAFHPELILEYTKTHVLQEKPHEQQADSLHHQYSIIDQFLKLNPRLKTMQTLKMKQEPQEDLSLRNSKIKKGIASESLANIFLNQGKVKKAIKIYEQLLLKYPEKKSYFAEQIEKLQNLS